MNSFCGFIDLFENVQLILGIQSTTARMLADCTVAATEAGLSLLTYTMESSFFLAPPDFAPAGVYKLSLPNPIEH